MKNDILNNYKSKVINFIKKFYIKNDLSRNYVLFGFLIIFVISALFSYSSTLKKKSLEAAAQPPQRLRNVNAQCAKPAR